MSDTSEEEGELYVSRAIQIRAVKLDPMGKHKMRMPAGVIGVPSPGADNYAYMGCRFFIDTLEGRMEAKPGDYIVTGTKGEKYPVKPDIFEFKYSKVSPSSSTAPTVDELARKAAREICSYNDRLDHVVGVERIIARHFAPLQERVRELERERNLAVAHDRQPYPTAAAYEAVCKSLDAAVAERDARILEVDQLHDDFDAIAKAAGFGWSDNPETGLPQERPTASDVAEVIKLERAERDALREQLAAMERREAKLERIGREYGLFAERDEIDECWHIGGNESLICPFIPANRTSWFERRAAADNAILAAVKQYESKGVTNG
jgi:hypothetical protein